jgi:hypothetical protein
MRGARTDEIAARLMVGREKFASEIEFIDDTGGWAGGVVDSCRLAGVELYPVNFSGSPTDPKFFNLRSEIHWKLAHWVKNGGWLPNVPAMIPELTIPTYTFNKGKFQLEEKAQIKARLGRSPNYADALATTFALPDMPAAFRLPGVERTRGGDVRNEYDPFAAVA